ncbi:hypothetical protein D3C81_952540 [compost metagenome]
MIGLGKACSERIKPFSTSMLAACTSGGWLRLPSSRFRLPPAQNMPSAPVKITARIVSSAAAASSAALEPA